MTRTITQKLRARGRQPKRQSRAFRQSRNVINRYFATTRPAAPQRRPRVVRPVVARRPKRQGVLGRIVRGATNLVSGGLGRLAGGAISSIFGSGDYTMSNPVNSNSLAGGTTPPMFGSQTGMTRIRHREFISDVSGSTGFAVTSYPIAPGLSNLFPWLSNLAPNYEQYRIKGLVVEFKSTSATALNSTNTALGVVGIATQYDASEPDFSNKQEAENYQGAQSANPSQSILHFVECARFTNPLELLYTRSTTPPSGTDIKFYDMGKIQLFTQGMQAVATIGELWVSYDIEFVKPKQPLGGLAAFSRADAYSISGATGSFAFGSSASILPDFSTLGTSINGAGNLLAIPALAPIGRYVIHCAWRLTSGTGTTTVPTGSSLSPNLIPIPAYFGNTVYTICSSPALTSALTTYCFHSAVVEKIDQNPATMTFTGTIFGANSLTCDVFVMYSPKNFGEQPKDLKLEPNVMQRFKALEAFYQSVSASVPFMNFVNCVESDEEEKSISDEILA